MRIGFDNTLQTRDPTYGSRDLVTWRVADDLYFMRQPGNPDVSAIQSELDLDPTRWPQINSLEIVAPQDGALSEFESGVTVKDGDAWWVTLRSDWVVREDDEYFGEWHMRLNEANEGFVRLDFDAREHRFDRREFGLSQILSNTWRVQYVVSFNSGPNRAGHFGFNVQVEAITF